MNPRSNLSLAEQAELLHGLAPVLGRRTEILEKDSELADGALRQLDDVVFIRTN